jgi:hypothetical protein
MTIQVLNTKFDKLISELKGSDQLGNIMAGIGLTARKMIYDRVKDTGVNAEGQKFRAYSTEAMLVGCTSMNASVCNSFFGKKKNRNYDWVTLNKINSKTGKKVRLAVLEGGYKKLREMHNRQTSHVDFIWSNTMWGGIQLKIDRRDELNAGIATIGPINEYSEKVLSGNVEKRGDILMLNNNEINRLSEQFDKGLQQMIDKIGLG